MNHHCFNRKELTKFLELEFSLPDTLQNVDLVELIEGWENWFIEFNCFATLLSQVLENKQKHLVDVNKVLEDLFLLCDGNYSVIRGLISIEEIDENFLDSMFEFVRDTNLEIEDNLIEIKRVIYDRKY